jgi:RNA polymerase sigma factor for flagellar operon FliA
MTTTHPDRPLEEAMLWKTYFKKRDATSRDAIILRYVPLVHYVLGRLGFSPAQGPEYEDLAGQGLLGLIDAVDRYDPAHGTQFSTYATLRIRGQMLDALRAQDWLTRSARRRARLVQAAYQELWSTLHRSPTDDELGDHLRLDVDEVRDALMDAGRVMISLDTIGASDDGSEDSLHEMLADENQPDPAEMLVELDLRSQLAETIRSLPEREQQVLAMYYHEQLTMKEIGEVLDLSESRVCQLHARAVLGLRSSLGAGGRDRRVPRSRNLSKEAQIAHV